MSCLSRDPNERPTAHELSVELEQLLDGLPKPWLSKMKPQAQRRR